MRAGRLRDIIHFGYLTEISDGQGGRTLAFSETAQAYGRAVPSASETQVDGDTRNVLVYTFESRYVPDIFSNMAMRLNDEAKVWTIRDVIDPSGRGERLTFTAEREADSYQEAAHD